MMEIYVPDAYSESIFTVNYKKLYNSGIRFLLFDLDNTIMPYDKKDVDEKTIHLFEMLKKNGMTPIIFSNSPKKRVEIFSKKIGIEYVSGARKPFSKIFLETLKKYKFKVNETAIIGDQLLTDIRGGNRVGIITVLVNPISSYDPIWTKIARMREKKLKEKMREKEYLKEDSMMKKCKGCGAILQKENPESEGFIREANFDKSELCERCFRIKNYGDYKRIEKNNIDFINILKKISDANDLVVLVIDIFGMNKDMKEITKYLSNDILLVFTKRDVLPLSVSDEKLMGYADKLDIPYIDKLIISSNKNYEFDQLLNKIKQYQKSKNVYVVGYTNAGKSTMINKLIYHYSDLTSDVTTSILPSTTLNTIEIKLDETLTLIDTPGILEEGNIIHYVDAKTMKKMLPSKEIKPITYQIRDKQYISIDHLAQLEVEDNNLTLFFSNDLKIERFYKARKNFKLKEHIVRVKENQDVVIAGLGFIKVTKNGLLKVYTMDGVEVYTRESLI